MQMSRIKGFAARYFGSSTPGIWRERSGCCSVYTVTTILHGIYHGSWGSVVPQLYKYKYALASAFCIAETTVYREGLNYPMFSPCW